MSLRSVNFTFPNTRGETLAGVIDMPSGAPLCYGVFAPCFTCLKESHAAHKVCRALAARGIAMLRFDMTGLGASEGVFADTTFTTRIADIAAACAALPVPPKLLIGHSISGTAALAAAQAAPSVEIVATLGSPVDPARVVAGLRARDALEIDGDNAVMTIAGRHIPVRRQMIDDMEANDMAARTAALKGRLIVFHGPNDEIVAYRNAGEILARATCDKELVTLSDAATHLLERGTADAELIAQTLQEAATA